MTPWKPNNNYDHGNTARHPSNLMLEQRTMLYVPYLQVSKLQMKLMTSHLHVVYTSEQAAVKRTGFPERIPRQFKDVI